MLFRSSWMSKAFTEEGKSVEAIWDLYLPKEQKIYEYLLGEKVTHLDGTISDLSKRFDMTTEEIVAFVDGGERRVGEPAKRQAVTNPIRTIFSNKRIMGENWKEIKNEIPRVP